MKIGYSAQCLACNSAHRAEIDARLLGGESTRAVSAWLEQTHAEKISFQGLANHKSAHCAVLNEAKARIAAATTPVHEAAADKIVADVHLLDELAGVAMRTVRSYDRKPPEDMPGAVVFTNAMREVRQIVVARHEILHGKKLNVDGITGLAEFLALGFDGGAKDEGPGSAGPVSD